MPRPVAYVACPSSPISWYLLLVSTLEPLAADTGGLHVCIKRFPVACDVTWVSEVDLSDPPTQATDFPTPKLLHHKNPSRGFFLQRLPDASSPRHLTPAVMFSAINPRKRARPHMSGSGAASTTSLPATLAPRPREASTASSRLLPSDSTASLDTSSRQPKRDNSDGPLKTAGKEDGPKAPNPAVAAAKQPRKTRSWYGSLGQKSVPSTQIARETIMGDTTKGGRLPDFSRYGAKKSTETLTDSDTRSVRTLQKPVDAAPPPEDDSNGPKAQDDVGKTPDRGAKDDSPVSAPEQNTDNKADEQPKPPPEPSQPPPASSGWLGWLGGMYYGPAQDEEAKQGDAKTGDPQETEPTQPEAPEAPTSKATQPQSPASTQPRPQSNSWFGLWYGAPTPDAGSNNSEAAASSGEPAAGRGEDVTMADVPPATAPEPPQPSAGSTWAFWSRDGGSKTTGKAPEVREQGELAVMGEGSESSPKSSTGVPVEDSAALPTEPPLKKVMRDGPGKSAKKPRRAQPGPMDLDSGPMLERPGTPGSVKTATAKPETPTSAKSMGQNLLLPDFKNTYRMQQNPSIVKQIARLLLRTRQPPANHVYLVKEAPKIKKAIAIGVHGLFPAAFLRPMIGQPTGTSMRFANHGAEAIRRWTEAHGCGDCEIEKIALEGEGKIADRVDNLWKLLLNWIDHIRRADVILVACHSQGVPVGIMLVAKLIDLGIITTARIGICAMGESTSLPAHEPVIC